MKWRSAVRSRLIGPTVALVSTLVCLLAIEGAARWLEGRRLAQLQQQLRQSPALRFHPLLGWEKVPRHERRARRYEVDVVFKYNSLGLRGPERDYRKPAGARRVLVLGDSFAEGFFAGESATVPAVLEQRLTAAGCAPCEVINGGTAGYSTDQEYLFYREEGRRYGADVVVLMVYYNDLLSNTIATGVGGGPKPLFALDGEALRLTNTPLVQPAPMSEAERVARAQAQPPWHGSVALRLLGNRAAEGRPALNRFLARMGLVPPSSDTPPEELTVFGVGERVPAMWRLTGALLRELQRAVESDDRYRLGRRWSPDKVVTRLAALCAELGIPLADPREPLRQSEVAGHATYYKTDFHWNETGHRVAAESVEPLVRAALRCQAGRLSTRLP
jgi:hypothetical protein